MKKETEKKSSGSDTPTLKPKTESLLNAKTATSSSTMTSNGDSAGDTAQMGSVAIKEISQMNTQNAMTANTPDLTSPPLNDAPTAELNMRLMKIEQALALLLTEHTPPQTTPDGKPAAGFEDVIGKALMEGAKGDAEPSVAEKFMMRFMESSMDLHTALIKRMAGDAFENAKPRRIVPE